MTPWPGAFTELEGIEVAVLRGRPEGESVEAAPGRVLSVGEGGILVACGAGGYRIERLRRAGGREMGAGEFARGSRLEEGKTFGSSP